VLRLAEEQVPAAREQPGFRASTCSPMLRPAR
jgi:hypothetical protein